MRIQVVSDLHLEFNLDHDEYKKIVKGVIPENHENSDILIIAGDLAPGIKKMLPVIKWSLEYLARNYRHVLYVMGNHEYYSNPAHSKAENHHAIKRNLKKVVDESNLLVDANVDKKTIRLLDNRIVNIDGVRFLGGTMWGDYIGDQVCIPELNTFPVQENRIFKGILTEREPDVVITHHLPSMKCVPEVFRETTTNAYFVSSMDQYLGNGLLLNEGTPRMWICGHTHTPFNIKIGSTKCLANPLGYPFEKSFDRWNPSREMYDIDVHTKYIKQVLTAK